MSVELVFVLALLLLFFFKVFFEYHNFRLRESISYMKTIKNILTTFGVAVAYSIVLYLAVSFYHLSFDASKWTEGSRLWLSVGVPIICIVSAAIVGVVAEEKTDVK